MKSVLLTGGKGYLGSTMKSRLEEHNLEVRCLDLRFEDLDNSIKFNIDYLVHIGAALRDRNESIYTSNVLGTYKLIQAINKNCKIIFLSSRSVYGSLKSTSSRFANESDPLNPEDLYSQSKCFGEEFIKASKNNYIILRSSLIYGLGYNGCGKNFVNKMILNGLEENLIKVYNPYQEVDPVYICDMVEIILSIINEDIQWNRIYNVSGNVKSVYEIANCIKSQIENRFINKTIRVELGTKKTQELLLDSNALIKQKNFRYKSQDLHSIILPILQHLISLKTFTK